MSRSSDEDIVEGENANIEFSIFTDPDNGVTTTASARAFLIRANVEEEGGQYFGITEDSSVVTVILPAYEESVNGLTPADDYSR